MADYSKKFKIGGGYQVTVTGAVKWRKAVITKFVGKNEWSVGFWNSLETLKADRVYKYGTFQGAKIAAENHVDIC